MLFGGQLQLDAVGEVMVCLLELLEQGDWEEVVGEPVMDSKEEIVVATVVMRWRSMEMAARLRCRMKEKCQEPHRDNL